MSGTPRSTPMTDDDTGAAVRERARQELRLLAVTVPSFLAGFALLRLEPGSWSAAGWLIAGVVLLGPAGLAWALLGTDRGRRLNTDRYVTEHAVLHHVDPGPGRRQRADRDAAAMARQPFAAWLIALGLLLPQAALAEWDDPRTAVPGAVLLVVGVTAFLVDAHRRARAGRRWRADPPGPPRD
ncbi:hypothetical protein [Blastococcus sp. SYSU DS0619]